MAVTIVNTGATSFTINGVPYLKNFLSVVEGDNVKILNIYDSKVVLQKKTNYADYTVDGNSFASAILLQDELKDVLFNRNNLGTDLGYQIVLSLSDFDNLITGGTPGVWLIMSSITLDGNKVLPTGVTLKFLDTQISLGGFTLTGDSTWIEADGHVIFDTSGDVLNMIAIDPLSEWFGAIPDGVTECQTAIQKAYDAFGFLLFLEGTYILGGKVWFKNPTTIRGLGWKSILKVKPELITATQMIFFGRREYNDQTDGYILKDICIDGSASNAALVAGTEAQYARLTVFANLNNLLIDNVKVFDMYTSGLHLSNWSDTEIGTKEPMNDIEIVDCHFESADRPTPTDAEILGLSHCGDVRIQGNYIKQGADGDDCIALHGGTSNDVYGFMNNISIVNNNVYATVGRNVLIDNDVSDLTITGNNFNKEEQSVGVLLNTINTVDNIANEITPKNVTISANTFKVLNDAVSSLSQLVVTNGVNVIIEGNTFESNSDNDKVTGIVLQPNSDVVDKVENITVSNNILKGQQGCIQVSRANPASGTVKFLKLLGNATEPRAGASPYGIRFNNLMHNRTVVSGNSIEGGGFSSIQWNDTSLMSFFIDSGDNSWNAAGSMPTVGKWIQGQRVYNSAIRNSGNSLLRYWECEYTDIVEGGRFVGYGGAEKLTFSTPLTPTTLNYSNFILDLTGDVTINSPTANDVRKRGSIISFAGKNTTGAPVTITLPNGIPGWQGTNIVVAAGEFYFFNAKLVFDGANQVWVIQ